MKRNDGFYWVLTWDDKWEPAEYVGDGDGDCWIVLGKSDVSIGDTHFKQVGCQIKH